jgi:hypothetical protein
MSSEPTRRATMGVRRRPARGERAGRELVGIERLGRRWDVAPGMSGRRSSRGGAERDVRRAAGGRARDSGRLEEYRLGPVKTEPAGPTVQLRFRNAGAQYPPTLPARTPPPFALYCHRSARTVSRAPHGHHDRILHGLKLRAPGCQAGGRARAAVPRREGRSTSGVGRTFRGLEGRHAGLSEVEARAPRGAGRDRKIVARGTLNHRWTRTRSGPMRRLDALARGTSHPT